ncbi:MAG: D-alanyl-D-alanine carboxypeptidase [Oscillospiraceae bacterium]|nr:D-alanyl-D-alanine carboxypeptidase [Oscillospiraceae bacterium]
MNNLETRGSDSVRIARRKRVFKARVLAVFIVILICGGIWLLASAFSQIKIVTELTVDASGYTVLEALPSQSEFEDEKRLEELKIENEIFEQKDSYPIDMIIQTPYCVMYDVQGRRVLYSKNAEERAFPASTTKIMTAALMMEYTKPDTIFKAGEEQSLVQPGSSLAYINVGSELDREMMLDAIMLPSGNDASYCAAAVTGRIIAENEELPANEAVNVFINKMNERIKEIGCKDTNFTCPDGFHDDNHYTTAMDLLRMTLHSEKYPEIAASGNKTYREVEFLTGEYIYWNNSNRLIRPEDENYYTYATGLKTGMTDMSGHCVVATAERFGHELIIVCLGSESAAIRWNDTIALFDAGFAYIRNNDN